MEGVSSVHWSKPLVTVLCLQREYQPLPVSTLAECLAFDLWRHSVECSDYRETLACVTLLGFLRQSTFLSICGLGGSLATLLCTRYTQPSAEAHPIASPEVQSMPCSAPLHKHKLSMQLQLPLKPGLIESSKAHCCSRSRPADPGNPAWLTKPL